MKINNVQPPKGKVLLNKSKNVIKNLANYTYNVVPRTKSAINSGRIEGQQKASVKKSGKFGTFFTKRYYACKSVANSVNMYEIPLLLSTLAIPITPPGGQPIVFVAGCILISPFVLKDIL